MEEDLSCEHEFFTCQVPAGDSCQPIYHQVCRKCRWDETKGIVMPMHIWHAYAVPQLEETRHSCGNREGEMTDDSTSSETAHEGVVDYSHPCFWYPHSRFYKVHLAWHCIKVRFRAKRNVTRWKLREWRAK